MNARNARRGRGGFAVVAVLVCLLVISMLGATMVQTSLEAHRGSRLARDRVQTMWLAESGIDRAAAQLRRDADYMGETWKIVADDLDGRRAAVVEISIEPATARGGEIADRRVKVTATLGEGPNRVTSKLQRTLNLN